MASKWVFLACLASTLFMTGVIWFVHVVHYPLFARVEPTSFREYHADHTRTTGYVVVIPMLVELLTSIGLVSQKPEGTAAWMTWLGLVFAVASWAATFLLSVPAHATLAGGFDAAAHRSLVLTNAIRVVTWTGHSIVLMVMAGRLIR